MFSRHYSSLVLIAGTVGLLAGCGSEPVEERTTQPDPVAAADRVSELPSRSRAASVLKRRDLPPEGVERQVSFGASGDTVCGRPKKRPTVVFDRRGFPPPAEGVDGGFPALSEYDEPEIGERFWICPAGFDPRGTLRVAVTDPTGATQSRIIPAPQDNPAEAPIFIWDWGPRPGDPLGEYRVRASQGTTEANGKFRLHAASAPNIAVLGARDSVPAPGDDVRVMLVGFKSRERVRMNIYASSATSAGFSYRTSILVRLGRDGTAIAAVPTAADDPPGCGVARVEIAAGPLDTSFCIQRQ